jgi:hypothetical protein
MRHCVSIASTCKVYVAGGDMGEFSERGSTGREVVQRCVMYSVVAT